MKYLLFILFCGYASVPVNQPTTPVLVKKQLSAQSVIVPKPKPATFHIPWSNDPWLQSGSWVVTESSTPQGPFVFYGQTTHNWIDIPMTNSQRFFNYCRAEDYGL